MDILAEQFYDLCEMRVDVGIENLNHYYPGWDEKINLPELNMSNPSHCICGQLWMQETNDIFQTGYDFFQSDIMPEWDDKPDTIYYGFEIYTPEYRRYDLSVSEGYEILASIWISKIEKIRAEKGTMV